MKLSILLSFFLVSCVFMSSYSQHTNYCGTDQAVKEHKKENKDYASEQAKLESFTKNYKNNTKGKTGLVYVIPVVFHVIHNFGAENISEQHILDGLKVINDDFRKLNSDTNTIDSLFKGIAADCEIEFRLAQKDPFGNCTNGITRTASIQTYTADNGVKNLVRWPNERYLNVWLVQSIASGAGGYAYYPGASSAIDGIVLRRTQFGTGYRSLTHEIGHYLNLPHTWGSTNDPELPSNCNTDDGVSDTPNTIGHTSCNIGSVTCGTVDNVQNYMEYSFCDRMFTEGQKIRMHAALNATASNRNNLWTTANLSLTGTDGPDYLCNAAFSSNKQVVCEGSEIAFSDESYNGQTQYAWVFEGGTPNTSTDKNPIITYNTSGIYDVTLGVSNNNSNTISIQKNSYVIVQPSPGKGMLFSESFESFSFNTDIYWDRINPDEGNTWEKVTNAGFSGISSLKINNISGNVLGRIDELISPAIDLNNLETFELSFKVAFAQKIDTSADVLRVYVSSDCGETWALRFAKSNTNLATVSTQTSPFIPSSINDWQEFTLTNVDASFFTANFKFKFMFIYQGGNNFYLDDINLAGTSSTVPFLVSPLNGSTNQLSSVILDWNSVDSVDAYNVQIDTVNDFSSPAFLSRTNLYISNSDILIDTESSINNLVEDSTVYYWRVRTIKDSVYSNWSSIWHFTTSPSLSIINELNYIEKLQIYPNPTSDETIISFSLYEDAESVSISLIDIFGRDITTMFEGSCSRGIYKGKIPKVDNPGIYFVKIRIINQVFFKRVIAQ